MDAGRALDALVAEKVMGWALAERGRDIVVGGDGDVWPTGERRWYYQDDPVHPIIARDTVPRYSTDIAAAWTVVEHMQAKGLYFHLSDQRHGLYQERAGEPFIGWWCEVSRVPDGETECPHAFDEADTGAATAPLAICRAALKAVGAAVPA